MADTASTHVPGASTADAAPAPDAPLVAIARYAASRGIGGPAAFETARLCLMDALACGFEALGHPACTRLLGPVVPGATLPGGARVPGTSHELDPVQAAFDIGVMIRWLDFNDTWLAAEWGHPSDNLGGILAIADYLSRRALAAGGPQILVRDLLAAMIKAYEIQGVMALENAFNRIGLDHVILVRVATAAVVTDLLGGTEEQIRNAVSNAWLDGGALRAYRHAPNTGSRKSWAAGDATRRGVSLALLAMRGEMGYPLALSAPRWGFYDALRAGRPFVLGRPFGSYVIENVLFKVRFPAEFHAQTAVECALALHAGVRGRLDDVDRVVIETQEPALRIIDKTGPLANPADRDHCMQYMVAVALVFGRLTAADYEDAVAGDPRIDALRARTSLQENAAFTADYHAPDRRFIGNAVQVYFRDGTSTARVAVEVPLGHPRRRAEALPVLREKFDRSLSGVFGPKQSARIRALFDDPAGLDALPVHEFVAALVRN